MGYEDGIFPYEDGPDGIFPEMPDMMTSKSAQGQN